jgi:oligosaccharide 4-alpha-D-glucosyltransferase
MPYPFKQTKRQTLFYPMRRFITLATLFVVACALFGQNSSQTTERFASSSGVFTVSKYKDNIYKISFQPKGYTHNESISDAVILKPEVIGKKLPVILRHDSLILNHRFVIASTFKEGDYRGFKISLHKGEQLFGGGERALPLNRRGYHLGLYNNPQYGYGENTENLNYEVPFLTSSAGYGLFFDNVSKAYFDLGKKDKDILEYGAFSGALDVYVIFGDYKTILHSYYQLTGTQPIPPRWAFGNLMSRFGYSSDTQVRGILAKMTQDTIPVDAAIFDLFWFGDSIKNTLGNLNWVNKTNWPNPGKMISDFSKQGVKTILITEPYLVEGTENYEHSLPYLAVDSTGKKPYFLTQFYFGKGGLLDLFRKDTQNWFWQFYKRQMDIGVEGWWGDLGEPETHPATMYHNLKDLGFKRLFSANEVHNFYGHTWTKMLFEEYAKYYPEKRLFSLNRSGYAGSQRYCIFPWTGDVGRNWSGLRAQLPVLLGMSMSGVPYVHSDAGGFAGGDGDGELYVRWLQFAAFTPIFKPHGTALYQIDKLAFSYPSEAALIPEPFRSYAKQAIYLRYRLLPYNYTLGYQQAKNGQPLMSPLYYSYPNDTSATKILDEYMWGKSILVAPVIEKGAKTRACYLPSGVWYSVLRKQMLAGHQWYTDSCAVTDIPYFYKEGSFIPEDKTLELAGHYTGNNLKVIYIPSSMPSEYDLFNDDGISKSSLKDSQYELLHFTSTGFNHQGGTISVSSNHGHYKGQPQQRSIDLVIPMDAQKPLALFANGKRLKSKTAEWPKDNQHIRYEQGMLHYSFTFTGKPIILKITR